MSKIIFIFFVLIIQPGHLLDHQRGEIHDGRHANKKNLYLLISLQKISWKIHFAVYTQVFRWEELKIIKIKQFRAILCAEIKDGRHTKKKNLCRLITFKPIHIEDSFWCQHLGFMYKGFNTIKIKYNTLCRNPECPHTSLDVWTCPRHAQNPLSDE